MRVKMLRNKPVALGLYKTEIWVADQEYECDEDLGGALIRGGDAIRRELAEKEPVVVKDLGNAPENKVAKVKPKTKAKSKTQRFTPGK